MVSNPVQNCQDSDRNSEILIENTIMNREKKGVKLTVVKLLFYKLTKLCNNLVAKQEMVRLKPPQTRGI